MMTLNTYKSMLAINNDDFSRKRKLGFSLYLPCQIFFTMSHIYIYIYTEDLPKVTQNLILNSKVYPKFNQMQK